MGWTVRRRRDGNEKNGETVSFLIAFLIHVTICHIFSSPPCFSLPLHPFPRRYYRHYVVVEKPSKMIRANKDRK